MNPHKRQCFVITVHFGDPARTRRAVASLLAGSVRPDRVLVIDHSPQPLTGVVGAEVVRPRDNGGYGAGINVGLGMLWAAAVKVDDVVICMNPDVEVYPTTLAQVMQWWRDHPEPALAGVMVEENGHVHSGVGYVSWLTGRAIVRATSPSVVERGLTWPYAHGAFVMAPYEVYLRLGGWPEQYFLYWEDVALSARARTRHIPVVAATNVRVQHCCSDELTASKLYYQVRNGALFMEQVGPPWLRVPWRIGNRLRWEYHRLQGGGRHHLIARALQDARRGVTGPVSHEPS